MRDRRARATRGSGFALVVATTLAGIPTAGFASAATSGAKLCAARDLALVIRLEDSGPTLASHKLDAAFREVIRARTACSRGDFAKALEIYDGADRGLRAD